MSMTKRHGLILLLLAWLVFPAAAQQQFTLEDLNFGGKNYRNMIPQNRSLTWWGDQLIHLSSKGDTCWTVDPVKEKEKLLFTLQQLNKKAGLTGDSERVLRVVSFPYPDQPLVLAHNAQNERMLINFKKGKVVWRQPLNGYQASEWNKQSRANAYVKDDNLYVTDAACSGIPRARAWPSTAWTRAW